MNSIIWFLFFGFIHTKNTVINKSGSECRKLKKVLRVASIA